MKVSAPTSLSTLCILALSSCLSPMNFPAEYIGGRLVVSGQISTLADRTFVQVGKLADSERLPVPVDDAQVEIIDENSSSITLVLKKPGIYSSETGGKPGSTYFVRVTSSEGKVILSSPQMIPVTPITDNISYSFIEKSITDIEGRITQKSFIRIATNFQVPNTEQPLYSKWEVEEVYIIVPTDPPDPFGNIPPSCYITQNPEPQRIEIMDPQQIRGSTIENFEVCVRELDQSFHTRHYFNIYHASLSNGAHEYWRRVNILANQTGSIFDSPPAEVSGNLVNDSDASEVVYGYFQAAHETFNRFYLVSDDLPFELPKYCEFDISRPGSDYPQECADCIRVRNSSYERPEWF